MQKPRWYKDSILGYNYQFENISGSGVLLLETEFALQNLKNQGDFRYIWGLCFDTLFPLTCVRSSMTKHKPRVLKLAPRVLKRVFDF